MNMSNITIDGQEMDLSQTMPSYAQVVSLYDDTSISVSNNETDKVLAGFTKAVSYFILELKDPSQTKVVTEELQKNKKYTVLSQ